MIPVDSGRLITDHEAALIREHAERVDRERPNGSEAEDYRTLLDTREALIEALERLLDGDPQGLSPRIAARDLLSELKGESA